MPRINIGRHCQLPVVAAVFLIPYFTMLLCAGLPMFFLELALGQYVGLSPACLFPSLSPIFSGEDRWFQIKDERPHLCNGIFLWFLSVFSYCQCHNT